MEKTTSMSCSVKSSVSPRSRAMRSTRRIVSRVSVADMPAVGSSRSRMSGSSASARPSSSCFWAPCERNPATSSARSASPRDSSRRSVSARYRAPTGVKAFQPRPRWDRNAAWTFSYTVSRAKMFVRWKERPTPTRHSSWGGTPVTSRPFRTTRPASARRCPVIRLKSVVLPAPLGPMMAQMLPLGTSKETRETAMKPLNDLVRSRTSSTPRPPQPAADQLGCARKPGGENEQEDDEDRAEHEGPVLRVGDDLLVQEDERQRADAGPVERPHPAEQRHDQHLGRLGPVSEVGEDAAVEDAGEAAREPGERPRQHEGGQLVAPHVYADELGALGVLSDRREHAPEGRADHAPEDPEAARHQHHRQQIEVIARAEAAQQRQRAHPRQVGIGDLGHPLLAAGDFVPLEADRPDDLREGQREHREVDAREAHAEEAEDEREGAGQHAGRGKGEEKRHAGLLHEDAGGVGADAEVGGVAEGDEAGVADQEIEADREEAHDDHVGRDERVEARAERGDEERGDHDERAPRHAGKALDHRSGRPRRPQGRTMSTTAMSAKTEKIEKRGKMRMPKDSTWP